MGYCFSKCEQLKEPTYSSIQANVYDFYTVETILGSGHFGVVRLCYSNQHPDRKFAIKTINKERFSNKITLNQLRTEVEILRSLDHPNIIRLYEVYEDQRHLHLVTEHCAGGELHDRLSQKGRFSEREASIVMIQVLRAINHLHKNGICHRDIKPENFLFVTSSETAELKLIDFGLSSDFTIRRDQKMNTVVGTPHYVAPEVLKGRYSTQCDLWSAGVLLYTLLCGSLPFTGKKHSEILNNVTEGIINMKEPAWSAVSPWGQDLVQCLINRNPKSRLSAEKALNHVWFTEAQEGSKPDLDKDILNSLKNYSATSKMQREAFAALAKNLSSCDIQELKDAFTAIDTSNTGFLSLEEVQLALRENGFPLASTEIQQIISNADFKGDGRINYSEFIAATLQSKVDLNEELLLNVFNYFDVDNSGYITAENLLTVFNRVGRNVDMKEAQEMIKEVDVACNSMINFREFTELMLNSKNS